MINASITLEKVKEYAQGLDVKGHKFLFSPDLGQLAIIVKEEKEKVKKLKEAKLIGVSPYYFEEKGLLTISLQPEAADVAYSIHAFLPVDNSAVLEQLHQVVKSGKGVEFYSVSDDMELISVRRVLTEIIARDELACQLERI